MWRPKDWINPHHTEAPSWWGGNYKVKQNKEYDAYETGADAILKSLDSPDNFKDWLKEKGKCK